MQAIDEIKTWLEQRNVLELMSIMCMLFLLVGLTAGYIAGEYRTKTIIKEQLQNHIIPEDQIKSPQTFLPHDYFSLDGTYLYYLVKTNVTIEDYKASIVNTGLEELK